MKQCPECQQTYSDETLKFCRDDGAELLSVSNDAHETLKLPTPVRAATTKPLPPTPIEESSSTSAGLWPSARTAMRGALRSLLGERDQSVQTKATFSLPRLSQITFAEGIEEYPVWSSNGRELLFSRDLAGIRKIFIKNVQSGEEAQLTFGQHDDIQAACSPDGKTILFLRAPQSNVKLEPGDVFGEFTEGDIWSLNRATKKEVRLLEKAFNPEYSPDGERIAFDASWAGPRRIWTVDNHGHNPLQRSSDNSEGVGHMRPRWSPDGRKIVFQNIERTKFDVRIFDLENGKYIWVTNDAVQDINPVWSPSGRFIYFSSYRGGGINIWRVEVSTEGQPAGPPQ